MVSETTKSSSTSPASQQTEPHRRSADVSPQTESPERPDYASPQAESPKHPDYLSPLVDSVFKRLFATEQRKYNTLHFLQAIFQDDPDISIDDISMANPQVVGEKKKIRGCVYDLHCSSHGKSFIIELQMYNEAEVFLDRAVWNVSKRISLEQAAGMGHVRLKGTLFIGLTDFDLVELSGRDYVRIALADMDTEDRRFYLADRYRYIFIQLNNFNKKEEECVTDLDLWLFSLKNMPNMSKDDEITRRVCERVEALGTFFKDAEYEALTPEEQEEYINTCFDKEVRRRALIRREEKGRVEGLEEGRAEGEAAGLERGRAEGQLDRSKEIARTMLADGEPIEKIVRYSGLSEAQIRAL